MSADSARMNQPRSPVVVAPPLCPASSPRDACSSRTALPGRHSLRGGPLARERALSVIECELLVLTYHCDAHVQTAINVDRAKWAPERSIPKHVQQNKITARRAARQRAKRARRGFCVPLSSVRFSGPAFAVIPRGRRDWLLARRDRLSANSKSDAVGKRESQPRF